MHVAFGTRNGFLAEFDLASIDGENGFTLLSGPSSAFGAAVSSIGDFNGDGIDDLIVQTRKRVPGSPEQAFALFGSRRLSVRDWEELLGSD